METHLRSSIIPERKYGDLVSESHRQKRLSVERHEIEVTNAVRFGRNVDDTGLCLQISDIMNVNDGSSRV